MMFLTSPFIENFHSAPNIFNLATAMAHATALTKQEV